MGRPIEEVLDRLKNVRKDGDGWRASCPVPGHGRGRGDQDPSFAVKETNGRVLINCFAGCEPEEIVGALGLSMADLFDKPLGKENYNGQGEKRVGDPSAAWEIRDQHGEVQAVHVRFDKPGGKKECLWRLSGADGYGLEGRKVATLPLYRTELLCNWPEDAPVVITEGEKAADALAQVHPLVLGTVTGAGAEPGREALEPLRGREMVLWPDADEPGHKHMVRIAKALEGIAAAVRVYEPSGMPQGGDAADHPAVVHYDKGRLLEEWSRSPVCSHRRREGFGENESPLPVKTVEEVLSGAGAETPWLIENLLARGAVTEFSGQAKASGKTTFWCHAIVACAKGEEHAGFGTAPAKYLYLTEQGDNFAKALLDSGLSEFPDHIRIVQHKDVTAAKWDRLIREAGAEAKRRGLDALIVDTFSVFARLKGSEENDAGPVGHMMRVLRETAQKYNIAVVLIRHAGKDGRPRGSSAFEAEADICVTLCRPEGRHKRSVRRISGIGRYGEWERNIELEGGRFVSLGTDGKIELNKAMKFVMRILPDKPEEGMTKPILKDKRHSEGEEFSDRTLDRALATLVDIGDIMEHEMTDRRGKPKLYWRAHKPPDEDAPIRSRQTPFPNGENESSDGNRVPKSTGSPQDEDVYDALQNGRRPAVSTGTSAGTPSVGGREEV